MHTARDFSKAAFRPRRASTRQLDIGNSTPREAGLIEEYEDRVHPLPQKEPHKMLAYWLAAAIPGSFLFLAFTRYATVWVIVAAAVAGLVGALV